MDAPIEWQATLGGQIDDDPHGDVNLGVRSGAWTFALRTDAPEIAWAREGDHGRSWAQVRGHAFASQMFISRWTDGAPDPARSWSVASAGGEAGWIGYGPAGLYAGGRGALDGVFPYAGSGATPLPASRAVGTLDAIVGLWRPGLHGWARGGVDLTTADPAGAWALASGAGAPISPHAHVDLQWLPGWKAGPVALAPRVELRAGAGEGQDDLTRTRVGGLNPWVVPLAGAAWAEWWVEDYAAARVGATVGVGDPGARSYGFRVSPFVDLATFDGDTAVGLGASLRAWRGRLFVDVVYGAAPWIERQANYGRSSAWVAFGWDWGTGKGPSDAAPPGPPGVDWPGDQ